MDVPGGETFWSGQWSVFSNGDRECYDVQVLPKTGHEKPFVRLLYWRPGRLGPDSRSSDIGTTELAVESISATTMAATGQIPLHLKSTPVSLRVERREGERASGKFVDHRGARHIELCRSYDTPAEHQIVY